MSFVPNPSSCALDRPSSDEGASVDDSPRDSTGIFMYFSWLGRAKRLLRSIFEHPSRFDRTLNLGIQGAATRVPVRDMGWLHRLSSNGALEPSANPWHVPSSAESVLDRTVSGCGPYCRESSSRRRFPILASLQRSGAGALHCTERDERVGGHGYDELRSFARARRETTHRRGPCSRRSPRWSGPRMRAFVPECDGRSCRDRPVMREGHRCCRERERTRTASRGQDPRRHCVYSESS